MKIWSVLPPFLPSALLRRQHQTIHALLNGVAAGRPRRGITRYLRFAGYLAWFHYISADEMRLRGDRHESHIDHLWRTFPTDRKRVDFPLTVRMVEADLALLKAKLNDRTKHGPMDDARMPISQCSTQLIEAQKKIITGGLPRDLLLL